MTQTNTDVEPQRYEGDDPRFQGHIMVDGRPVHPTNLKTYDYKETYGVTITSCGVLVHDMFEVSYRPVIKVFDSLEAFMEWIDEFDEFSNKTLLNVGDGQFEISELCRYKESPEELIQ